MLFLFGLICVAAFAQTVDSVKVHRLELADCDDVAFGPSEDLYLACHSPQDRLQVPVRGNKAASDEMDAYVLRLNPRTGKLVFATRFGGRGYDGAWRIKVDAQGFAYATGLTKSDDFPVTPDALQRNRMGKSDAFLVKIAPDGQVVYSTLIGGLGDDLGNALELDKRGNIYLGGVTSSADFPGQRTNRHSTEEDAFVCRIQLAARNSLCQVFGGGSAEKLTGIVLDGERAIYAAGSTNSKDFPTKQPIQKELRGSTDLFLTRLELPSLDITFSTFFGGSGVDSGWGIALGKKGDLILAGITDSTDLAGTAGSYQDRNHGKTDAFLTSIRIRNPRQVHSTYFGGSNNDESGYDGGDVKVDRRGNVWVAGITYSEDMPTRNASQSHFGGGNGDGFVAVFDSRLKRLCHATYFGDRERNLLEGLAISPSGMIAVTGVSFSETESPFRIRFTTLYVGANVLLMKGNGVCSR